jgi:hypothetical protein
MDGWMDGWLEGLEERDVLSAWYAWLDGNSVSWLEVFYSQPYLNDCTGTFMPEDDGRVEDEICL